MLLPAPAPQAGVSANSTTSPEIRAERVSIAFRAAPATKSCLDKDSPDSQSKWIDN